MTGVVAVFGLPFTVVFNANGGSGTMASQSLYYGVSEYEQQTLNGNNAFAAPDQYHVFAGWNTAADGSGYTIANNASADSMFTTAGLSAGGTITLYAQWRLTGFELSVTKSPAANEAVGTLKLLRVSDYSVVATENSTTHALSYLGAAGEKYRIVLDMAGENEEMYVLQGVDGGNEIEPESGDVLTLAFVVVAKTLYPIVLPTADTDGRTITVSVTSPSQPDGTVEVGGVAKPAYAEGRNVVVHVDAGDGRMPEEVYLDDLEDRNFATYTRESMDGDSFTILGISGGCKVRVKTAVRKYDVAASAETGHGVAFSGFTVKSGDPAVSVSSVDYDTEVTFKATMNTDYQFEGWYLNGTKIANAGATYTAHVTGDMKLKAKAKAKVVLDVEIDNDQEHDPISGSDVYLATRSATWQAGSPIELWETIGSNVAYALSPVSGTNANFWGWYNSGDTLHTNRLPWGTGGATSTGLPVTEATSIKAWMRNIAPTGNVVVTIDYASGCDETMGTISIDGTSGAGAQTEEKSVTSTAALAATTNNGFQFVGWYANASAQGDKVSASKSFTYTMTLNITLYARFEKARRALCRWEGGDEPKTMTWRSKTYEASKPFAPSACRVDARGYVSEPGVELALTVDMFSAPDAAAAATGHVTLGNITNQDARRLPHLRPERYMQIEIVANREIDALLAGTSMGGLAT